MRRQGTPLYGSRYCADSSNHEVHNLDNEQNLCHIDEIISGGTVKRYASLSAAHKDGYANCKHCMST